MNYSGYFTDKNGNKYYPEIRIEKGNWKPKIAGSEIEGTALYNLQAGSYVKIGKIVVFDFSLGVTSFQGSSGMLEILGFPFALEGQTICNLTTYGSTFNNMICNLRHYKDNIFLIEKNYKIEQLSNVSFSTQHYIYGTGTVIIE